MQATGRFKVPEATVLTVAAQVLLTCTKCMQASAAQKKIKTREPTTVYTERKTPNPNVTQSLRGRTPEGTLVPLYNGGRAESETRHWGIA